MFNCSIVDPELKIYNSCGLLVLGPGSTTFLPKFFSKTNETECYFRGKSSRHI